MTKPDLIAIKKECSKTWIENHNYCFRCTHCVSCNNLYPSRFHYYGFGCCELTKDIETKLIDWGARDEFKHASIPALWTNRFMNKIIRKLKDAG